MDLGNISGLTFTAVDGITQGLAAIVYLVIGFLLGPSVFNFFYFDPIKQAPLLEKLTEIAVLISF